MACGMSLMEMGGVLMAQLHGLVFVFGSMFFVLAVLHMVCNYGPVLWLSNEKSTVSTKCLNMFAVKPTEPNKT